MLTRWVIFGFYNSMLIFFFILFVLVTLKHYIVNNIKLWTLFSNIIEIFNDIKLNSNTHQDIEA